MNKIPGRIRRDILANSFKYFSPELLVVMRFERTSWQQEHRIGNLLHFMDVRKQKQGQWRAC